MCGRYYVDDATAREILRIVRRVSEKFNVEARDVYPSGQAPILAHPDSLPEPCLTAQNMQWGFPGIRGKGVIFNARSETALDKRMFRDSILRRRCIVPATAFYEWDKNKDKIIFQRPDAPVMFMAGFYKSFANAEKNITADGSRFVVLTTSANESVSPIHERMPVLLDEVELEDWIFDEHYVEFILHKRPGCLKWRKAEN